MRKIENRGNLPSNIALFAKELSGWNIGNKETEFYEMSSIDEFEKKAVEIGYEIVPALDSKTDRAFLVGFEVTEGSQTIIMSSEYFQLKMYFIELSTSEFNSWHKRITQDRIDQQIDMYTRRENRNKPKVEDKQ